MAVCTQTGLVVNDEDLSEYDVEEAKKVLAVPPKGQVRKPDGTLIPLPKKP